jgi:hypothetical protein
MLTMTILFSCFVYLSEALPHCIKINKSSTSQLMADDVRGFVLLEEQLNSTISICSKGYAKSPK